MNKKYDFTKQQIVDAAAVSESRTEMMRMLGIRQGGGGYQSLLVWCRKYDITPPNGSGGPPNVARVTLSDTQWFANGARRSGQATRKRLIKLGHADKCSVENCPSPEPMWRGSLLTLQVDHINGDRWDNRIENVRIICPNCHTQTKTYANNGSRKVRHYCVCGAEIWKGSETCKPCSQGIAKQEAIQSYPSLSDLVILVESLGFVKAGVKINKSDNAIRKHLGRNGVDWRQLTTPRRRAKIEQQGHQPVGKLG